MIEPGEAAEVDVQATAQEVRLLRICPGDVVIVSMQQDVDPEFLRVTLVNLRAILNNAGLSDVPVAVVAPGIGIGILRKDQEEG